MARRRANGRGRLRIGDHWSAISIIALSQDNPLKAVAEFVENSIDARAKNIEIVRGRRRGKSYLKITDDGEGIPRDNLGRPDFRYVATHICDSIKKQLKRHGAQGIQGEFGIGLLSFWTLGEALTLTSPGEDGTLYEMSMKRNEEGYEVRGSRRTLFGADGTELGRVSTAQGDPVIQRRKAPLVPGIRTPGPNSRNRRQHSYCRPYGAQVLHGDAASV